MPLRMLPGLRQAWRIIDASIAGHFFAAKRTPTLTTTTGHPTTTTTTTTTVHLPLKPSRHPGPLGHQPPSLRPSHNGVPRPHRPHSSHSRRRRLGAANVPRARETWRRDQVGVHGQDGDRHMRQQGVEQFAQKGWPPPPPLPSLHSPFPPQKRRLTPPLLRDIVL